MKAIAKFIYPQVFSQNQDLTDAMINLEAKNAGLDQVITERNSTILDLSEQLKNVNGRVEELETKFQQLMDDYNAAIESTTQLRCEYDTIEAELLEERSKTAKEVRERYDQLMDIDSAPWSIFEVLGFDDQGVKVNFNWNRQFIMEINKMGFVGDTDEECVEKFFALMKMLPTGFFDSPEHNV
jgi:uncharacterized coiled-coil DUF342 family protein